MAMSIVDAHTKSYNVKEVGSFHVGGRQVSLTGLSIKELQSAAVGPRTLDPNGEYEVEQMYVQYIKLAMTKARYPLLMWHGAGLTGVTWETKPDGNPGWQQYFLKAGYDVYVSDAVERGRSSWARYPEIFKSEPVFWTKKRAWEMFRIGPDGSYSSSKKKLAYEDTQFPLESFDQFCKQSVAYWYGNDEAINSAYYQLIQKVGPCVLVAHSQGVRFSVQAAVNAPKKIKGLILIEGGGGGSVDFVAMDLSKIKDIPVLIVYGDHWKESSWVKNHAGTEQLSSAMKEKGVKVDWLDLPAIEIKGNSHMLMMDRNSDQIAGLIQDWLKKKGMMK
jgi:pimeloyl-ACP methyl ester carboxylesterase